MGGMSMAPQSFANKVGFGGKFLFATLGIAAVAGVLVFGLMNAQQVRAQSSVPDWQTAAGGKMQFDVASVKQNTSDTKAQHSNVDLSNLPVFAPTGGLLSATNLRLPQYVSFAYKLTIEQYLAFDSQLPKWANTNRYDIEARATGNPTKDQYRLMMQSLLADRFRLAIHFETKVVPVLVLVLDKPGKLGPQLRQHLDDPPCPTAIASTGPVAIVAGGFPEICGKIVNMPASTSGRARVGARDVSMAIIASSMSSLPSLGIDRPVIDKTGLAGTFDSVIEVTPQINGPQPPGSTFQPDPNGPTFLEALKDQLGLKLVPQTGPVDVFVLDQVEQLSEN
jgi:uncharacterized protein (TIGR03435 family)